jgi:hypothetical protein
LRIGEVIRSVSGGSVGKMTVVVIARRTGEIFEGANQRSNSVIDEADLHPAARGAG